MPLRIASVTMDCQDVQVMADFWSAALGYVQSGERREDVATVEDPADRDVEMVFIRVPELKRGKNRVHLDIGANDMDVEVERLVALGAQKLAPMGGWTVMLDPEGNEFCIVQAAADDPIESWRS